MKELGEYLQAIREESGVSLEEASHDLDADMFYLEALEEGNTRGFKDLIETKDLLLRYAKYLGADEKDVSDEFDDFLFERTSKIDLDDILKAEEAAKGERVYSPYTRPVKLIKPLIVDTQVVIRIMLIMLILLVLLIYLLSRPSEYKGPIIELRIRSLYEIKLTK